MVYYVVHCSRNSSINIIVGFRNQKLSRFLSWPERCNQRFAIMYSWGRNSVANADAFHTVLYHNILESTTIYCKNPEQTIIYHNIDQNIRNIL